MQRRTEIPREPRFGYVTEKAFEFLLECGFNTFPISIIDVLNEVSDYVTCMSWSKARVHLSTEDPLHLKQLGADGRVLRIENTGDYLIVYDDTIDDDRHNAWTIMHEIGHVILGHLTDFDLNDGLSDEEYGVLEKEAHYFAAEVFMPSPVVRSYGFSVGEIALLFDVSKQAADKKHKRVFETSYDPIRYSRYDDYILRNFSNFLVFGLYESLYRSLWYKSGIYSPRGKEFLRICRKCFHCYSYITDEKAEYCQYCGKTIEIQYEAKGYFGRLKEEKEHILKSGINHIRYDNVRYVSGDNGGRIQKATVCPVCLNHQHEDEAIVCSECGNNLFNECFEHGSLFSYTGNYCPTCGERTSSCNWYSKFEKRYKKFLELHDSVSEGLYKYPYWEYIKRHPMLLKFENHGLISALMYSAAYVDDNDNIYVYIDDEKMADVIMNNCELIQDILKNTDNIDSRGIVVRLLPDGSNIDLFI